MGKKERVGEAGEVARSLPESDSDVVKYHPHLRGLEI